MSEMLTALGQIGLVPVVKIDRAADAVPLRSTLLDSASNGMTITCTSSPRARRLAAKPSTATSCAR